MQVAEPAHIDYLDRLTRLPKVYDQPPVLWASAMINLKLKNTPSYLTWLYVQAYGTLQGIRWASQLASISGGVSGLATMLSSEETSTRHAAAVSLRALCLANTDACKVT